MQAFRSLLKYVMPAVVAIMLIGLLLSRVISPDESEGPAEQISVYQAENYIGQRAEVCGRVASADHVTEIGGSPTFINLDQPHPDAPFTVVIWEDDRGRWESPPEELYANREICVTGEIDMHEGTPQIVLSDPQNIYIER